MLAFDRAAPLSSPRLKAGASRREHLVNIKVERGSASIQTTVTVPVDMTVSQLAARINWPRPLGVRVSADGFEKTLLPTDRLISAPVVDGATVRYLEMWELPEHSQIVRYPGLGLVFASRWFGDHVRSMVRIR